MPDRAREGLRSRVRGDIHWAGRKRVACSAAVLLAILVGSLVRGVAGQAQVPADDPVKVLVGRLDLERYKATIKALTRFGDRLQGTGRNPHYHQPTDNYAAYSDRDFRLGLNAAQTTLGGVAQLAGASVAR